MSERKVSRRDRTTRQVRDIGLGQVLVEERVSGIRAVSREIVTGFRHHSYKKKRHFE